MVWKMNSLLGAPAYFQGQKVGFREGILTMAFQAEKPKDSDGTASVAADPWQVKVFNIGNLQTVPLSAGKGENLYI